MQVRSGYTGRKLTAVTFRETKLHLRAEMEDKLWPKIGPAIARACVDANKPRKRDRAPMVIEAGVPLNVPDPPPPPKTKPAPHRGRLRSVEPHQATSSDRVRPGYWKSYLSGISNRSESPRSAGSACVAVRRGSGRPGCGAGSRSARRPRPARPPGPGNLEEARGVVVQANGKIVVGGTVEH